MTKEQILKELSEIEAELEMDTDAYLEMMNEHSMSGYEYKYEDVYPHKVGAASAGIKILKDRISADEPRVGKPIIGRWYTPEEKTPPTDIDILCCISGRAGNITFDHACEFLAFEPDHKPGENDFWSMNYNFKDLTVHYWAEMEAPE